MFTKLGTVSAFLGLAALVGGFAVQPAHAQVRAARDVMTLQADDVPAGYTAHTVPLRMRDAQGSINVFVDGTRTDGPWFIESAVILDTQFLASPTETQDFVTGFSDSFAESSHLTFAEWQEIAPAAVGERSRMYGFRYQANEDAGVAGSDLAEGDGAIVVFERGGHLALLVILAADGNAEASARQYAGIADGRMLASTAAPRA
jgi:hypothetical protein